MQQEWLQVRNHTSIKVRATPQAWNLPEYANIISDKMQTMRINPVKHNFVQPE